MNKTFQLCLMATLLVFGTTACSKKLNKKSPEALLKEENAKEADRLKKEKLANDAVLAEEKLKIENSISVMGLMHNDESDMIANLSVYQILLSTHIDGSAKDLGATQIRVSTSTPKDNDFKKELDAVKLVTNLTNKEICESIVQNVGKRKDTDQIYLNPEAMLEDVAGVHDSLGGLVSPVKFISVATIKTLCASSLAKPYSVTPAQVDNSKVSKPEDAPAAEEKRSEEVAKPAVEEKKSEEVAKPAVEEKKSEEIAKPAVEEKTLSKDEIKLLKKMKKEQERSEKKQADYRKKLDKLKKN